MAAKMAKFLWSTSLRLQSPLLGSVFKTCHVNTARQFPAILSSVHLSSLLTKPIRENQSTTGTEIQNQTTTTTKPDLQKDDDDPMSLKSRLMRIVTEEDDTFHMPKAAEANQSQSVFDDQLASKFVNCMMWDGKKSTSQRIFDQALQIIKRNQLQLQRISSDPESVVTDPTSVFHQAVENVKPIVGCIPLRRAGKVYQVPSPLRPVRQQFFAIKWIIDAARKSTGSKNARMSEKLAKELLDAYNNEGAAIRKKQDLHKTAEANRAFAHYRWW